MYRCYTSREIPRSCLCQASESWLGRILFIDDRELLVTRQYPHNSIRKEL
jgi:hypothetical protein